MGISKKIRRRATDFSGKIVASLAHASLVVTMLLACLLANATPVTAQINSLGAKADKNASKAGQAFQQAMDGGWGRTFLAQMPKGADIHNHLTGAVYAETWLQWAAADGLCADIKEQALREPQGGQSCADSGWITAREAQTNEAARRAIINGLSLRSYVPVNGFSGHDQFFITFSRMARKPGRLGDMLAAALDRAGHQNILYLELMETPILGELFPILAGVKLSGDVAKDYQTLMQGDFGKQLPGLVKAAQDAFADAFKRKDALLKCGTSDASPGCDVEIRFLYQVIREFNPAMVFGQFIIGWEVIKNNPKVVGVNLVAPEDGFVALRDYDYHMHMMKHLHDTQGRVNVSLHAGELTLGLVRPKNLRFHIWNAITIGGATRIGHGIDIPFERDSEKLLQKMRDEKIMVEINLTSNDVILGVKGRDHPLGLYRRYDVPWALSTDDEGVSRIDLTHEYLRGVKDQGLGYFDLKESSRNSLTYSFLPGDSLWDIRACTKDLGNGKKPGKACQKALDASLKARLQWKLEEQTMAFEAGLKLVAAPRNRTLK